SGAKAGDHLTALTARLKSCPSTNPCAPRLLWDWILWPVRTAVSHAFFNVRFICAQTQKLPNGIRQKWKASVARHGRTNASAPHEQRASAAKAGDHLTALTARLNRLIKLLLILLDLRRGLKPRPFKAAVRHEFFRKL